MTLPSDATDDFANKLLNMLDERGFWSKFAPEVAERLSKSLPAGQTPTVDLGPIKAELSGMFTEAAKNIQLKPNMTVVHHGLKELIGCKQCNPELQAYVAAQTKPLVAVEVKKLMPAIQYAVKNGFRGTK
jgi:hypothetical protein